ncbi:(R)-stereoselective amidase [Aquisphaera giovannonii]|uniref:(R)-stereoselective amidase n=1 Tax=Aquisphaera giovannonii TaxID=406548 RepID=A0A5B9W0F7_9BACT|nr:carbon-nitrogen hydrolase family protein [Aquisphaera giovannonii]QEH33390.1 (R)-stereoselective amidase [Aquisphaera giovannonii]
MKIQAAAIQMRSDILDLDANLQRADALLRSAREQGAELAVFPELFNTGYSLCPDFGPFSESADGPTLSYLRQRSRAWNMVIAGGYVEREGRHLYDSLAVCTPDGGLKVYRKRNLVFWERFRFRPGDSPLVVPTRFGRIGFAICADMIYRRVWEDYRGRIDLAVVSAAWPDFACRQTGRRHWLLGHVGPLSHAIPAKVARDLGVPVVFANQCGETKTTIPVLRATILDRFAGQSSICDGRHGVPVHADREESVLVAPVTIHNQRGLKSWSFTSHSAAAGSSSASARS